ncbi:MAG: hypothetical protein PHG64_11425 [Paludibacter sp.]|nr:hypothetical protein [Paludibacter sp.]
MNELNAMNRLIDAMNQLNDAMKQPNTVLLTIISGVVVYVLCECIKEIWLAPLQEYKSIKKKVSYALTMLAAFYSNPTDLKELTLDQAAPYKEASTNMRLVASELRAFIETISWLQIGIPDKNRIYEASRLLIGLSNSFFTPYGMIGRSGDQAERNDKNVNKVRELLNLHLYEE